MDRNSPSLLCLPIHIRIKIYKFCGLIRQCPIDLNVEAIRQRWSANDLATRWISNHKVHQCQYFEMHSTTGQSFDSGLPPGLECFCPSLPHQLLSVSRAMHLEVETVLYGLNQFKVSRHLPGHHLEVLSTISWRALKLMRSLHVSLLEVSPFLIGRPQDYPIEKLDSRSTDGSRTIHRWEAICKHILSQIPAQELKFSLSCNVHDIETARLITQPLKYLQSMVEASICLAADPARKAIKEVARKAVLQLARKTESVEEPSLLSQTWTTLPKEIRLHILKYTELVDRPGPSPPHSLGRRSGFEIYSGNPFYRARYCCQNCNPTLSTCTCHSIYAAHSTTCTCPAVPPLFTVNRAMNADATEVFYSSNRFIISGNFAASRRFICNLPTAAFMYLRTIDLGVEYAQMYDMREPDSETEHDWDALIATLPSRLQMPKVWLSVDAGQFRDTIVVMESEGYGHWLGASHVRLFDPLYRHLKGAAKPGEFQMFLSWRGEHEEMVERRIMGAESERKSKGELPWEARHYMDPHGRE